MAFEEAQFGGLSMPSVDWGEAVVVECSKSGDGIPVNTASEALDILLTRWPTTSGRHFFAALQISSAVEEGLSTPAQARLAFIAAAREAPVEVLQHSQL